MKDETSSVKTLGLFRHAKSDWSDHALRDFDRGLNARGRKGAALIGRHIMGYGLEWDRIIASPAARMRQTIEAGAAGAWPPVEWTERAYLAGPGVLAEILRGLGDGFDRVMLCGHNPGLEDLLQELAGRDRANPLLVKVAGKFPTAAFAVIELDIADWSELAPGCGRLVHLGLPRELDAKLGPVPGD